MAWLPSRGRQRTRHFAVGPSFRGAVADSPDEATSSSHGCCRSNARRGARCVSSSVMSPLAFLLSRLECAPSPQALCVWVHVLAWELARRAERWVAQRRDQSIRDRLQIRFDASGKQAKGTGCVFPCSACLGRATFCFL